MASPSRFIEITHSSTETSSSSQVDNGHRKFYDFEFVDENLHHLLTVKEDEVAEDSSKLIHYIRDSIIGSDYTFLSPFGLRKGRILVFVTIVITNLYTTLLVVVL